jgi:hypothetical protein
MESEAVNPATVRTSMEGPHTQTVADGRGGDRFCGRVRLHHHCCEAFKDRPCGAAASWVQQPQENPEARIANIPTPDIRAGEPSRQSATAHGNKNLGRPSPSHKHADLSRYLEAVKTQVENNFDQHSLDAPDGTSADIAVVIRGDGQPGEPHLMMPSGYFGVDSACLQSVEQIPTFGSTPTDCLQSVEQIPTFGSTPTDESVTVNLQCTVRAR